MFRNTYILLHIFIYEVDCENVDKNFVIRKIYISLYIGTYIYICICKSMSAWSVLFIIRILPVRCRKSTV